MTGTTKSFAPGSRSRTGIGLEPRRVRNESMIGGRTHRYERFVLDQSANRRNPMLHIPVLRWGEPYKSVDIDKIVHFATGEPLAEVSRANGGLIERGMRHA